MVGAKWAWVAGCAAFITACAPAAEAPSDGVLLRAARALDGNGDAVEPAVVHVQGERIVAVGADVDAPSGTEMIDLGDVTLLPGLIDAHVHITASFSDEPPRDADTGIEGASNAEALLMSGFTTVRSLGSADFADVTLRDAIAAGTVVGPRLIVSGQGLTDNLVAAAEGDRVPAGVPAATEEELRAFVRSRAEGGADWLKIFGSRSSRSGGTPTYSLEQLEWAIDEATLAGLPVSVHAHAAEAARRAVEAGGRTIEHGALLDEAVLDLMVERGTFFAPNLYLAEYYLENGEKFSFTEEALDWTAGSFRPGPTSSRRPWSGASRSSSARTRTRAGSGRATPPSSSSGAGPQGSPPGTRSSAPRVGRRKPCSCRMRVTWPRASSPTSSPSRGTPSQTSDLCEEPCS